MEREKVSLSSDDYIGKHDIKLNNENYLFIEYYDCNEGEGMGTKIILKRESDGKYFSYFYDYYNNESYYDDELVEVFPENVIKTIYK